MIKSDLIKEVKDNQTLQLILDHVPLHIVITDPDGTVIFANKEVENITGFKREEILGQNPRLWGRQMGQKFYEEFWDVIKNQKKVFTGIVTNKRKNGKIYHAAAKVSPILDEKGELIGFSGIEQDITEIQHISDTHDLNNQYKKLSERPIL